MKKILLSLSLLLVLFMGNITSTKAIDNAYYYREYNVNIKVNEDNTVEVTETMTVFFNERRHGIIRSIPTKWELYRADGSSTRVKAVMTDIKCSTTCNVEVDGDFKNIRLGDEDEYVTGDVVYGIKYTYNLGSDKLDYADEFYYNIVGSGFDTRIDRLNFEISFPKDFDTSMIGFSTGPEGSIGYNPDYLSYSVDSNIIKGTYYNTLEAYNAFTIRVELEDGYFKGVDPSINYLCYLIPIIGLVVIFIMWLKYGKEKKYVTTIEFDAPEGFNPLDVALIYNGRLRIDHLLSLIVYLAEKGYIKISETSTSKLNKDSSFKLFKVKEYDGDNQYEQAFMDILFEDKDEVTKSHIEVNCSVKLFELCKSYEKDNRPALIKKGNNKRIAIGIFIIVATFLNFYLAVKDYSILSILFYFVPLIGISVFICTIDTMHNISGKIMISIWSFMFSIVPSVMVLLSILDYIEIVGLLSLITFTVTIIEIFLLKFMSKRTETANEMYGRIKGLRKFIKTAELSRLQLLVNENPTYFYKLLPYALVLNLNKKWIEKFTDIRLDNPDFYNGRDNFYFHCMAFNHYIVNTSTAIMSRNTHSGSGSSGGGFSGGGGGGGGSSSW